MTFRGFVRFFYISSRRGAQSDQVDAFGRSKLEGTQKVCAAGGALVICGKAWVFSVPPATIAVDFLNLANGLLDS